MIPSPRAASCTGYGSAGRAALGDDLFNPDDVMLTPAGVIIPPPT